MRLLCLTVLAAARAEGRQLHTICIACARYLGVWSVELLPRTFATVERSKQNNCIQSSQHRGSGMRKRAMSIEKKEVRGVQRRVITHRQRYVRLNAGRAMKLIWSAVAQIVVTNPFSMVWAMSKFRTPLDGEKSASLRAEIKSVTTVTDMNKSHAADAVSQVTRVGLPISLALATSRPVDGMQKRIVVAAALAKAIRAVCEPTTKVISSSNRLGIV